MSGPWRHGEPAPLGSRMSGRPIPAERPWPPPPRRGHRRPWRARRSRRSPRMLCRVRRSFRPGRGPELPADEQAPRPHRVGRSHYIPRILGEAATGWRVTRSTAKTLPALRANHIWQALSQLGESYLTCDLGRKSRLPESGRARPRCRPRHRTRVPCPAVRPTGAAATAAGRCSPGGLLRLEQARSGDVRRRLASLRQPARLRQQLGLRGLAETPDQRRLRRDQAGEAARRSATKGHSAGPEIATNVVGTANPERILQNIREVEEPIDPELLSDVQRILSPVHDVTWQSGRPENN